MHPSVLDIASRYQLRRSGARHVGQCPQCGGSTTTDRFVLFDDGGFKCFSCGFKGDRIKWLREIDGLSCKEAHDQEGKGCTPSCPNYGPCRNGQTVTKRPRTVAPRSVGGNEKLKVVEERQQAPEWTVWASAFVDKASAALAREPQQLEYLASRGIDAAAAHRHRLGWSSHDLMIDRQSIGLSRERDGKTKLWVPGGLVIPFMDTTNNHCIHQIRIRRTPEARARFLQKRKYDEIEGSGRAAMTIGPQSGYRGVVVVEAELDGIAVAAAHGGVLVFALKTVAAGLTPWQHRLCQQAPVILVCLDADSTKEDGQMGAGPKAVQRWTSTFRQARYWPVPAGKDPGDYVKDHQGDLRAWIEAGLPPEVCPTVKESLLVAAPPKDAALFPDQDQRGNGGEAQEDYQEEPRILVLNDGREIWLTDDQQQWRELQEQGRIVMSSNELQRLQTALVGLDTEQRAGAIEAVIAAKEIFPGAYIRRGVAVAA